MKRNNRWKLFFIPGAMLIAAVLNIADLDLASSAVLTCSLFIVCLD